jgi:hypothetical protein
MSLRTDPNPAVLLFFGGRNESSESVETDEDDEFLCSFGILIPIFEGTDNTND